MANTIQPQYISENEEFLNIIAPEGDGTQYIKPHSSDDESDYDDTDYDVYSSNELTKKKKRKYSKLKKETSGKEISEKRKNQKKNIIIALCILIWCIIAIPIIFYLLHLFNVIEVLPENGGRDRDHDAFKDMTYTPSMWTTTYTPSMYPSYNPTTIPTDDPSVTPTLIPTSNPTENPTIEPTNDPTISPTMNPTTSPTIVPTKDPTLNPSIVPSRTPTIFPTSNPINAPTLTPTYNPTIIPTISPTNIPTISPTNIPTISPTNIPTISPTNIPTISPTNIPTMLPTNIPTVEPTVVPTIAPSNTPTITPTMTPTNIPTTTPTVIPTITPTKSPTFIPTNVPSSAPTSVPSATPTYIPSINPSSEPSMSPSIDPTTNPTNIPSITPTNSPTQSPTTMMQTISTLTGFLKALFEDTTSAFRTINMDNVTANAIHFVVQHMPFNVTLSAVIPISSDLLAQCPNHYGFELFAKVQETEFPETTRPMFIILDSEYDPTEQSLTTLLPTNIFHNFTADVVVSCTPGSNIVVAPGRRLLQNPNFETECKASEIICPIESGRCNKLKPFNEEHYGVDYRTANERIVSAANGRVERIGASQTYDNVIIIRTEDGSALLYGNLNEIKVTQTQSVLKGDIIATSNPTHIHIEYVPNGEIYASKKRIDASDCFAPFVETSNPAEQTTVHPTKSPLVPPDTHSPTISPTLNLPQGSITVRDSGRLADDSFATYIDGFKVCETEIGQLNTCAISFIRPGLHTLTVEVLIAPDQFGTFNVQLSNGWIFTDNSTSKDAIEDLEKFTPPAGWKGSWEFMVPFGKP